MCRFISCSPPCSAHCQVSDIFCPELHSTQQTVWCPSIIMAMCCSVRAVVMALSHALVLFHPFEVCHSDNGSSGFQVESLCVKLVVALICIIIHCFVRVLCFTPSGPSAACLALPFSTVWVMQGLPYNVINQQSAVCPSIFPTPLTSLALFWVYHGLRRTVSTVISLRDYIY